jgi:outer membrane receptor for ferrienterochelin and colicin
VQLGDHYLEFGAGVDFLHTGLEFSSQPDSLLKAIRQSQARAGFPDSVSSDADYLRAHAFAQDRISFGEDFHLQLGGRWDYYRIISRGYFSPRINASYAIDPLTTLRGALGVYYQSPGYEKLIDGRSFFDLTSPRIAELKAEKATHYVLGIERLLTEEWQVRLEGYYKNFSDLIVQEKKIGTSYISTPREGMSLRYPSGWSEPVATVKDSITTVPVNAATGEAYGFELLLQKIGSTKDSPLNGWISYALAWANRYRDGVTFPFNFDQRHTLNVVLNYRANSWLELGANFQFGSGFPYTPAVGFHPIIVMRRDSSGAQHPAIATNVFGETLFSIDRGGIENVNSARLPAYHRLDARATFYAGWWGLDWSIYLDVINVYNHTNILSRSYSVDKSTIQLKTRDVSMLPILPTLGVSVKF